MVKVAAKYKRSGGRPISKRSRAGYVREIFDLRCLSGALLLDDSLDQEKVRELITHLTRSAAILQSLVDNIPLV